MCRCGGREAIDLDFLAWGLFGEIEFDDNGNERSRNERQRSRDLGTSNDLFECFPIHTESLSKRTASVTNTIAKTRDRVKSNTSREGMNGEPKSNIIHAAAMFALTPEETL